MANNRKNSIPPTPNSVPRDLQPMLNSMRENIQVLQGQGRGNDLDAAITKRDLQNGSVDTLIAASADNGGGSGPGNPIVDPGTPSLPPPDDMVKPANVMLTASDVVVTIGWWLPSSHADLIGHPPLEGYAYTSVFRSDVDEVWDPNSGTIQYIGDAYSVYLDDGDVIPETKYFYWLYHVNTAGEAGPVSDRSEITTARPIQDQTGWVDESTLTAELNSRVDLIEGSYDNLFADPFVEDEPRYSLGSGMVVSDEQHVKGRSLLIGPNTDFTYLIDLNEVMGGTVDSLWRMRPGEEYTFGYYARNDGNNNVPVGFAGSGGFGAVTVPANTGFTWYSRSFVVPAGLDDLLSKGRFLLRATNNGNMYFTGFTFARGLQIYDVRPDELDDYSGGRIVHQEIVSDTLASNITQVVLKQDSLDNAPNLIKDSDWLVGTFGNQPSNYDSHIWDAWGVDAENEIVTGQGPYGSTVLWRSEANAGGSQSGGWEKDFAVDSTKHIRYVCWFKREEPELDGFPPSGDGDAYLGCSPTQTENIGGGAIGDPYFAHITPAELVDYGIDCGDWFCVIGYVYAAGTATDLDEATSGIYSASGTKLAPVTNYRSKAGTVVQRHRAYFHASTGLDTQIFSEPRVEYFDGSEVAHEDIFKSYAAVEERMTITENDMGDVLAQLALKVDVNGHVAGIGVQVTDPDDADPYSEMIFIADQFAFLSETTEGDKQYTVPFSIKDGTVLMNDVEVKRLLVNNLVSVAVTEPEEVRRDATAHLDYTAITGELWLRSGETNNGHITKNMLDPDFTNTLLYITDNTIVTGGSRFNSATITQTTQFDLEVATLGQIDNRREIKHGGAPIFMTFTATGGVRESDNATGGVSAPSIRFRPYRRREGGAWEEIGPARTETGTVIANDPGRPNPDPGQPPYEPETRITNISFTYQYPDHDGVPVDVGVNYEYKFIIESVSGSWGVSGRTPVSTGGGISATASEPILSTNGVAIESLIYNGEQYFTANPGGGADSKGVTLTTTDPTHGLWVNGFATRVIGSDGAIYDKGSRVYSANNRNIGTVANTYAEGNHNHTGVYLPIAGKAADSDKVDGVHAVAYNTFTAGLVQRHSSGYIFSNYFNMTANTTTTTPTDVCIQTGNDNYLRWQSLATFASKMPTVPSATTATTVTVNNYDSTTIMRVLGSHQTGGSDNVYSTSSITMNMSTDILSAKGFNSTSALKYKDITHREELEESLRKVCEIGGKGVAVGTFKGRDEVHRWFIADEVNETVPEVVAKEDGAVESLCYTEMIPDVYAAVSLLTKRIEELENAK